MKKPVRDALAVLARSGNGVKMEFAWNAWMAMLPILSTEPKRFATETTQADIGTRNEMIQQQELLPNVRTSGLVNRDYRYRNRCRIAGVLSLEFAVFFGISKQCFWMTALVMFFVTGYGFVVWMNLDIAKREYQFNSWIVHRLDST